MEVQAHQISKTFISYVCPFCKSRYKKNGEPTKKSKYLIHHHGNHTRKLNHRIEYRGVHCDNKLNPDYRDVAIIIDENTEILKTR